MANDMATSNRSGKRWWAILPLLVAPVCLQAAQMDGDYRVNQVGNQFEWLSVGAGNTKWPGNSIAWYYNPANAPASFSTDEILGIITSAAAKWQSVCNIKFNYQGQSGNSPFSLDKKNVIGWSTTLLSGGADGLTETWMQGTTVVEADIAVWRDSPAQRAGSNKDQQRIELTGVITHELGHLLGLAHSDQSDSIMYAKPYHDYVYTNTLRQDDINGCVAKYGAPASTDAPALTAVSVNCPSSVASGTTAACTATGNYGDGTAKAIIPVWSSSDPASLSVAANGSLTAGSLVRDTAVTIGATFTSAGVTKTAITQVTVKAQASVAATDPERVFNWLENNTANLFSPTGAATATYLGYTYRYYARTNSMLASKNGRLYYYGSLSTYRLVDLGALKDFLGRATAAGY